MTSATIDRSEFRHVLRSGPIVGVIPAAAVIVYLLVARLLSPGIVASLLETVVVLAGAVAAAFLPGFFASSRATQGIASAAAIGLWGTIVFMAIDIILLRPFHAFPWTWDAIGGGGTPGGPPGLWGLGTFLARVGGGGAAGRAAPGGGAGVVGHDRVHGDRHHFVAALPRVSLDLGCHRRWQHLVVPAGLVDARNLPRLDGWRGDCGSSGTRWRRRDSGARAPGCRWRGNHHA